MKFYIHKDGYLYSGDHTDGAREATQEEINNHVNPPQSLDDAKAAQWAVIKTERDRREVEPLPYLEKVLDFDDVSSKRLTWAIDAARTALTQGLPFEVEWTCYDNSVLTMSANDIIGIPLAVAQRSDSLHQIARNLREDIYSKNTVEEVKAIVWPT